MKAKVVPLVFFVFVFAAFVSAKDRRSYEKGELSQMIAVNCGYEEKGGAGVEGAILGNGSGHLKTREMMCPEYTLTGEHIVYHIRPKDEKHPALLPVGEQVEFWVGKDRIHLRVPEGDHKEREYWVVSMTPRAETPNAKSATPATK